MPDINRPLLFVDIDGVLHPASNPPGRQFEKLPGLVAMLQDWPELDVVVSSSWRFDPQCMAMLRSASSVLAERIVGSTGPARVGRWARHREITAYMARSAAGRPCRALDDAAGEFPKGCLELLRCDPEHGFDEGVNTALRTWLKALDLRRDSQVLPLPSIELLERAQALCADQPSITVSYLQRHLLLGYRVALGLKAALERSTPLAQVTEKTAEPLGGVPEVDGRRGNA